MGLVDRKTIDNKTIPHLVKEPYFGAPKPRKEEWKSWIDNKNSEIFSKT